MTDAPLTPEERRKLDRWTMGALYLSYGEPETYVARLLAEHDRLREENQRLRFYGDAMRELSDLEMQWFAVQDAADHLGCAVMDKLPWEDVKEFVASFDSAMRRMRRALARASAPGSPQ